MADASNKTTGKKAARPSEGDETASAKFGPEPSAEATADALRMLKLLWQPAETNPAPSRGPKPRITLDQIVEAAVRLADEQGQEALSMRRVAAELNASAMSLYTYVKSKDELLELMVDKVFGERQLADPLTDWRSRARSWAVDRWSLLRRHPWVLAHSLDRYSWGPNAMDTDEELVAALSASGLEPRQTVESALAVHAYVNGAARSSQLENTAEQATGTSLIEHHAARSVFYETYYDADRFPATTKIYSGGGYDEFSLDPFLFGLDRLLDGIEALLKAGS